MAKKLPYMRFDCVQTPSGSMSSLRSARNILRPERSRTLLFFVRRSRRTRFKRKSQKYNFAKVRFLCCAALGFFRLGKGDLQIEYTAFA